MQQQTAQLKLQVVINVVEPLLIFGSPGLWDDNLYKVSRIQEIYLTKIKDFM